MIIVAENKANFVFPETEIFSFLNDSKFVYFLTGSRFFFPGVPHLYSDWDFMTNTSGGLANAGFVEIGSHYPDDSMVSSVWRYENIDIQVCTNAGLRKKLICQNAINTFFLEILREIKEVSNEKRRRKLETELWRGISKVCEV